MILGRPFAFSGTQHDRPLRLFRRGAGRWIGAVHETVELEGDAGRLRSPLQHRTIPDMQTFLRKINEYTTLEAIKFEREGRTHRTADLAVRPVWTFLKLYLGKQGSATGWKGSSSARCRACRSPSGTGSTASGSAAGPRGR